MKRVRFRKVFFITMGFFFLIFALFSVTKSYSSVLPNKAESELTDIDNQIAELEDMKKGYEAKAIKHANQAERLQFINGELQTAKKHWKLAEDSRRIATRIQKEIDELKIKKLNLQK